MCDLVLLAPLLSDIFVNCELNVYVVYKVYFLVSTCHVHYIMKSVL